MKRNIKILTLLMCFAGYLSMGQGKITLSGTIKDAKTGEQLIGAVVSIEHQNNIGVASNEYGFYSITLAQGEYTFLFKMIGYKEHRVRINLLKNTMVNVSLDEDAAALNEVVVTGKSGEGNVLQPQMGMEKLDIKDINKIPVLMGEKDILKTIQLLPGVKSAGEGNAGFYVRGGGLDQNLILLDEAPVYNASHLLGFFSTFNSDAVKDLTLYKGSMPAQYGGRLSSVLDIKMNDGDERNFHVGGGIGLISSKISVEGPIVKDRGSFLIHARRTYADVFLKLSSDTTLNKNRLYFYDLNGKGSFRINDNNRLYMSIYNGRDVLGFGSSFNVGWGNTTGTLRWNHLINPRMFSNTSLIYSNYYYKVGLEHGKGDIAVTSNIEDYNVKHEYQFYPDPANKIRFGVNAIYHKILPGQLTASEGSGINPLKLQSKYALENAAYFSNEWKASERLTAIYGLRVTSFSILGAGEFYSFNGQGRVTDTLRAANNQLVKTFLNVEPRFSLSYLLSQQSSVKASYARTVQNLHLISNSTTSSPTDIWLPSSLNTRPEIADQVAIGYFRNIKENQFEFSSEVYYKGMLNQIDYRDGANTQANEKIEGELLYGIGRAYGIELLLKKKTGRLTGWVGYTLSRSEKKIAGINGGDWYLAKQDRTHDISIVAIFDVSKKLSLSATWVYNTGNAVTFPTGKYQVDGQVNFQYTERNGYRMPSYHRLDIGATWYVKRSRKYEASWNVSVYNAYARENAYMIKFQQDPSDPSRTQAIQTSLFRMVPSVTYNFKY